MFHFWKTDQRRGGLGEPRRAGGSFVPRYAIIDFIHEVERNPNRLPAMRGATFRVVTDCCLEEQGI